MNDQTMSGVRPSDLAENERRRQRGMDDLFDQFLQSTRGDPGAEKWRLPTIEVADTMFVCARWFRTYEVPFTGADVVAMAKLILDREEAARAAELVAMGAEP